MTDLSTPNPQPEQSSAAPVAGAVASSPLPPAKKSNKGVFILLGAAFVGVCLCAGVCAALFGAGLFKVVTEQPKVESVVGEFMDAMESREADKAYALFSTRSKRNTSLADVEKLLSGNNYVLFEGYQGVTITNLNLTAAVNTNPDLPQGTVATANGVISYAGGYTGAFRAILEQDAGNWRLFSINITVPPDKFAP